MRPCFQPRSHSVLMRGQFLSGPLQSGRRHFDIWGSCVASWEYLASMCSGDRVPQDEYPYSPRQPKINPAAFQDQTQEFSIRPITHTKILAMAYHLPSKCPVPSGGYSKPDRSIVSVRVSHQARDRYVQSLQRGTLHTGTCYMDTRLVGRRSMDMRPLVLSRGPQIRRECMVRKTDIDSMRAAGESPSWSLVCHIDTVTARRPIYLRGI